VRNARVRTVSSAAPPARGCGGIGRRARFRSVSGQPGGGSSPLIRTIIVGLKPPRLARAGGSVPTGAESGSCGHRSFWTTRCCNVLSMASRSSCSSWETTARRSSSDGAPVVSPGSIHRDPVTSLRIASNGGASSPVTSPSSLSSKRVKNAMLNCRLSRSLASR
jgi:hypothetical protein